MERLDDPAVEVDEILFRVSKNFEPELFREAWDAVFHYAFTGETPEGLSPEADMFLGWAKDHVRPYIEE